MSDTTTASGADSVEIDEPRYFLYMQRLPIALICTLTGLYVELRHYLQTYKPEGPIMGAAGACLALADYWQVQHLTAAEAQQLMLVAASFGGNGDQPARARMRVLASRFSAIASLVTTIPDPLPDSDDAFGNEPFIGAVNEAAELLYDLQAK